MPLITQTVSVPANGSATPLVGNQYEFLGRPAAVAFGIVADAVGVVQTIFSGSDLLAQEGPVVIRAAGAMPVNPDDFYLSDIAAPGDRLSVLLRNTTGAAIAARVVVQINFL